MGDRKKTALADIRIAERISGALLAHGIETLPVPSFDALPPPVASHPDMLFFKLGGRDNDFCLQKKINKRHNKRCKSNYLGAKVHVSLPHLNPVLNFGR